MHRSLIAVALLLVATLASAQVYKWTDASGTVHYSETPPAQGTKYAKVTTTGTVEPLAAPTPSNTADHRETPAEPTEAMADTPENRSKLCESLNTNLTALKGSSPVVMQQEGKTVALDDAQRQQQIESAQGQYNQFCMAR